MSIEVTYKTKMTAKEITALTPGDAHKKVVEELLEALESGADLKSFAAAKHKELLDVAMEQQEKLDSWSESGKPEDLNDAVYTMKSNEASDINNNGPEAQRHYLTVECGEIY
jgi:hypothetical protein